MAGMQARVMSVLESIGAAMPGRRVPARRRRSRPSRARARPSSSRASASSRSSPSLRPDSWHEVGRKPLATAEFNALDGGNDVVLELLPGGMEGQSDPDQSSPIGGYTLRRSLQFSDGRVRDPAAVGLVACGSGGVRRQQQLQRRRRLRGEGKEGGTLNGTYASFPDYMDPALSYTAEGWTAMGEVYIPLLTYKHANGAEGSEVDPRPGQRNAEDHQRRQDLHALPPPRPQILRRHTGQSL